MKYTSNDIQIILIHPVVLAGQGGLRWWITLYISYKKSSLKCILKICKNYSIDRMSNGKIKKHATDVDDLELVNILI